MEILFEQVTVLAGLAVLAVQQILKLKVVPAVFANKYPVPTLIVLSVIAAVVVVWQNLVQVPTSLGEWIVQSLAVLLVAAVTYNVSIKHWSELRELESEVPAE